MKSFKFQNFMQLGLGIVILILLNIAFSAYFIRLDLTTEKRYTLSETTKGLLKELDDDLFIKVYLEGDFPAGFKRLQSAMRELLDEFRVFSGNNLNYEFVNPSESDDPQERRNMYSYLSRQGLQPANLYVKEKGRRSELIVFPSAMLTYKERQIPLNLLVNRPGENPESGINHSIEGLEFAFANALQQLTTLFPPRIAFIEGHGELDEVEVRDITEALSGFYKVDRVRIDGRLNALKEHEAIIIAKPDSSFSEKDKFIIDQFIMRGGKSLWCIDAVDVNMDSLSRQSSTSGLPMELNLEDQLFKYGVRINADLVQDVQAARIPVNTAMLGAQPQWELLPWLYFPVIVPRNRHPVVNNLNAIRCEFISTMDTVRSRGVMKTILLTTSQYTRLENAPVNVSLSIIDKLPPEELFNKPYQPVAVLLEGEFESVFTNRVPPEITGSGAIAYREKSISTKMIIVSDGDVIRNQVHRGSGKVYPLGYDRYTGQEFGNKDFILSAVGYLLDESGLTGLRSKELQLRLLDRTKITEQRLFLQAANVVAPVLLVLIFGMLRWIKRRNAW